MSALDRVVGAAGRRTARHATPAYRDEADEAELVLAAAASVREALALAQAGNTSRALVNLGAAQGILDSLAQTTRLTGLPSWTERTSYDAMALMLARSKDSDGDYDGDSDKDSDGDEGGYSQGKGEQYADSGHQADGKKRYPVTEGGKLSEKRIRAAWSYINQGDNADKYSNSKHVAEIKSNIKAAGHKIGIEFADDDKKAA